METFDEISIFFRRLTQSDLEKYRSIRLIILSDSPFIFSDSYLDIKDKPGAYYLTEYVLMEIAER